MPTQALKWQASDDYLTLSLRNQEFILPISPKLLRVFEILSRGEPAVLEVLTGEKQAFNVLKLVTLLMQMGAVRIVK
jgi:hypothetical protein